MSDRVTFLSCPCCGGIAAVGWEPVRWVDDQPVEEAPVEFDCARGCILEFEELMQVFRRAS